MLTWNGYEYYVGKSLGYKSPFNDQSYGQIFTHPVIFDYFLNYHSKEFIRKFPSILDNLQKMAWYRNDLQNY